MSLDPVADFESLLKKNEFLLMVCKSSRPPSPISIAYGSSCGYRGSWCLETLVSAVAEKGGAVVTVTSETADMLPKTRQASGYTGQTIVDPHHLLADRFKERRMVDIAVTAKSGYPNWSRSTCHPGPSKGGRGLGILGN